MGSTREGKRSRRLALRAATALMASSLALSGCSMFDPYLEIKNADDYNKAVNFNEAIEYAEKYKDEYRDALGNEATFRSILGVSLISLGAATLGLGITGASTTAITVTGLTGAAGFGAATWLDSTPRQRAYVLGHNAIGCAIEAVIPLRPDATGVLEEGFKNALKALDQGENEDEPGLIEKVEIQIGVVQRWLGSNGYLGMEDAVRMEIERAQEVLQAALAARSSGIDLRVKMTNAALNLKAAVDRINGQVYLAIVDNQSSLESLQGIIGGLGQVYSGLTTVPESA